MSFTHLTGLRGSADPGFDMRRWALKYADEQQWRVLPVRAKKSIMTEWQRRATTDLKIIESWPMWAQADGVGIATGAESGLLVLDVDGPTGEASVSGRDLPPTWEQTTGRDGGGRHLWYRTADRLRSRAYRTQGLDLRGEGGYVVAAPSLHPSGRRYVAKPAALADVPEWLVGMAGPAPEVQEPPAGLPAMVAKALSTSAPGSRSERLFAVYRWATAQQLPDLEIAKLILRSPISSKVREKADPTRWILDDIQRFRERQTDPVRFSAREHVAWTSAAVSALPTTRQKVVRALQGLAVERGNTEIVIGKDELAIRSSTTPTTVTRTLRALTDDGLIRRVSVPTHGHLASRWALRLPPGVQGGDNSGPLPAPQKTCVGMGSANDTPHAASVDPSDDASRWAALGSTWRYLEVLTVPKTRRELEAELEATKRSAQRNLARLVEWGLVSVDSEHVYRRVDDWKAKLPEVAASCGTSGRKTRETNLLERKREHRRHERVRAARSHGAGVRGVPLVDTKTGEMIGILLGEVLPEDWAGRADGLVGPIVLRVGRGRGRRYHLQDGHLSPLDRATRQEVEDTSGDTEGNVALSSSRSASGRRPEPLCGAPTLAGTPCQNRSRCHRHPRRSTEEG